MLPLVQPHGGGRSLFSKASSTPEQARLVEVVQGYNVTGRGAVHFQRGFDPQVAQKNLTAAPGELQDVFGKQGHTCVPHNVQVKHVLQILLDLMLAERTGEKARSG